VTGNVFERLLASSGRTLRSVSLHTFSLTLALNRFIRERATGDRCRAWRCVSLWAFSTGWSKK